MSNLRAELTLLALVLVAGCQQPGSFVCTASVQCTHLGQPGVCTPAGACALPDPACPSQLRYVHFAPPPLADACYDPDHCRAAPAPTCLGTICEDFEGSALDPVWTVTQNQATVAIDGTRACRGKQSLHVRISQTSAAPASGGIAQARDLPNPVYIRAFYYFAKPLPVTVADFEFMTLVGLNPPFDGSSLTLQNGRVAVNNFYEGQVGNIIPWSLAATVPEDRWVCIEWLVSSRIDHTGSVKVWFNDQPVPSLSLFEGLSFAPRFGTVGVRYGHAAALIANYDAWIDDLVVDSQPIGCQR